MNLDCPLALIARKRMLPKLVERTSPGTIGHCSDNRWSNGEIFMLFLKHFNHHLKHFIPCLFLDNHKTHITLEAINSASESYIIMVVFPPHTTHRLQKLDISILGT
ncbi:hypothetical protein PR048_016506 [Dryococelus australis]|uniref:DDE-1 domain-containing protein n=1 Tax=Dryococelus australis TaxID=614101 RepID=A0ABQ9HL46_9NEOP|nr:hypothetical protein PR048_016506 [Dryococelus australis]